MLSKGDATHSTQLPVIPPHQIPRDWRAWEKRYYNFTLLSTCRQRVKPERLQKVSPRKGGFLQGDLFVSRKDVYVNWADSYWTGGTATSRDVLGSLLGSGKSSPLHYRLRCSREDENKHGRFQLFDLPDYDVSQWDQSRGRHRVNPEQSHHIYCKGLYTFFPWKFHNWL